MQDAPAVYFCRPTEGNIKRIAEDCAKQVGGLCMMWVNGYAGKHFSFESGVGKLVYKWKTGYDLESMADKCEWDGWDGWATGWVVGYELLGE